MPLVHRHLAIRTYLFEATGNPINPAAGEASIATQATTEVILLAAMILLCCVCGGRISYE